MSGSRSSLRARLTALCSLLSVAALVVTGFDSYQRERATLERDAEHRLHTLAHMVALNTRSGVEFDGQEDVQTFLRTVIATSQVQSVAVYTHDGSRFAIAGEETLLPERFGHRVAHDGDTVALAPMPYKDGYGDDKQGHILVRASGEPMRARLRDYLGGLVTTDLVALLALGMAAYWLLDRLLRPIATLLQTADQVRRTEDYALRAKAVTDDEVGALVLAFNAMLEAIQARDAHLAGNAERLEQIVRERTEELRRALDAAESSTRAKSTFVANMSHEIRTPLNAILGMTELALEAEDPNELHEYLGVIRSAGSNLLGVLCDILDLSKIESDKLDLSVIPTDLESLVMDALRPLTARLHSKNLELSADLDPRLAAGYRIDDVRVRQILTNLVGNAIKFTESGSVHVAVRRGAERDGRHEVEFVIEDTGVGIPQDRLAAIFEPFTQADNTITRRFAGTGLGLHITGRLCKLMGGTIRVESRVGTGSTFTVVLPLEVCASPLPGIPALPADTRLLLISSASTLVASTESLAARVGASMLALREPGELGPLLPLRPHDIVLLDDRDPDHDATIRALVAPGPCGQRPLLIATAFQDLATAAARCRDSAFAGYVTKPLSARELAARANQVFRPQRSPASEPRGHGTTSPSQPRAMRILVAEDNAVNQKLIQRILSRDGHEVTIAENGRVCCEAWTRGSFDLVLMDMQMPVMSGLEATAAIRAAERVSGRHTPILALTANTTIEDRRACLDAGMDDVLPKPVSIPKLRATLARFATGELTAPIPTEVHQP